jgi:hypothetical protein
MARKKAPEGIELLRPKQDPVSIQEITLMDWYAGFALLGSSPMSTDKETAKAAFDLAEEMLKERAVRIE